ncbi:MAG: SPASM domain-containing protein [Butyrivibrio sp.]|nr:SPASM domain-containing protein [Acetatifactor muris]MCM1561677.1 SPASM domain-containing protein [Butyrivibrio sp.]
MKKFTIIWDMTRRCPFHCLICCMDASSAEPETDELDFTAKCKVVDQIRQLAAKRSIQVDLSGGEIMADLRNLEIAEEISHIIGKDNLGISTSGYGITEERAAYLSNIIGEIELTMDTPPGVAYRLRPLEYAQTAAHAVPHLKAYGIHTGIQTVLTKSNCQKHNLAALYDWLCNNRIDEWSLLRFYPTGRGADYPEECLSDEELLKAVREIQRLDRENPSAAKPSLHFHYTIKGHENYTTECRCVKKSIGILPNGDVTACFWAFDRASHISEELFRLGNVKTESLSQILESPRARYWQEQPHICPLISVAKEDRYVSDTEHYDRIA